MSAQEGGPAADKRADLPLVSVIIPTYNRREYVCEAIDSALAQTYPNVEIIVVDDGSIDGTGDVIRERYDDRIRYRWQENRGAAATRNRAMELANGDCTAFLDSDDIWVPEKLALQMALMIASPRTVLVSGHVGVIDATGLLIEDGPLHAWQTREEVSIEDILLRSPLNASTLLFRRDAAPLPPFDIRVTYGEDWQLCLWLASQGTVGFVQHVVAYLRSHEGSITAPLHGAGRVARQLADRLYVIEDTVPRLPLDADLRRDLAQRAAAQEYAEAAAANYAAGQDVLAQTQAATAVRLDPGGWSSGVRMEALARHQALLVAGREGDAAALQLANVMANSLVSVVPGYRAIRRQAIGNLHIGLGFGAQRGGDRGGVVRHMLAGLALAPEWRRNRGVWSITVQALLGPRLSAALRRVAGRKATA